MDSRTRSKDQPHPAPSEAANPALPDPLLTSDVPRSGSRRKFLGNVRGVAMAAATVGAIGFEPLLGSKHSLAHADNDHGQSKGEERAEKDAEIRIDAAKAERKIAIPPHTTNGDEEGYAAKWAP